MDGEGEYIGCSCALKKLRAHNDRLNAKVVEQVNETEELVMLNNFARESNECHFKKCLQERIADIASWRWVLEDLAKRLQESIDTLQYEHNAVRVVEQRLQKEIDTEDGIRPGALTPKCDAVEQAIYQEFNFLRAQKKKFEKLILEIEQQVHSLQKTKKRIEADILHKDKALSVEESCASINVNSGKPAVGKRKKKRGTPVNRWENRCSFLKRAGLRAMSNAIITRQQVRGARVHLSIAAQAYSARVDSALRRRLHTNKIKLQDLKWQREEAVKDYNTLQEELETTEVNLLETMGQERVIEARRADRFLRPARELTKDDVDRNLKDEIGRLRSFAKQLRSNRERITVLQKHLTDSVTQIDCCAEDLIQIISLDEERIAARGGDVPECSHGTSACGFPDNQKPPASPQCSADERLMVIKEEDEDDYPFDQ